MFSKIIGLVEDEKVIELLKDAENKFNSIKSEVEDNERKLNEVITSRDKYKTFVSEVKGTLGITEGEELSKDTLKSKISEIEKLASKDSSEKENILKKDITNLEDKLKTIGNEYESKLKNKDVELFKTRFDVQAKDSLKGFDLINDTMYDIVYNQLVSGAEFDSEAGSFVYKNEDGTTKRNSDGTLETVAQKAEAIKSSEEFSPLFKANVNSGSGTGQGEENEGRGLTDYEKALL